jgi:hypothetical protein
VQHAWIGPARILFIPLIVKGSVGWDPPPPDYVELIRRRIYFDPDPDTGEDRSLSSYIASISYGRAWLNATVSAPVTLTLKPGDSPWQAAMNAQPEAHLYEYLAVVMPRNEWVEVPGQARCGPVEFSPPRTPNATKGSCYFLLTELVGTWAMEVLHITTGIGDYYNAVHGVLGYEEMDKAIATHPTVYTKRLAGWLDEKAVPLHFGKRPYTLHAVGLPQPPPEGRVTGVRVQAPGSARYLMIEARLRCDRWERGLGDAERHVGIPMDGVLIYEFSPESDSWAKKNPTGPWPPIEFRKALTAGDSYTYPADQTSVLVRSATAGGFRIELDSKEIDLPSFIGLYRDGAIEAVEHWGLRPLVTGASGPKAWVWRQSPPEGTRVPTGSTVRLQARISPIPDDDDERPRRGRRRRRG